MILVPDGSLPSQQSLKFESLATDRDPFSSSVTLRVANHTLACPTAIHHLQLTIEVSRPRDPFKHWVG